ncbi:MAG: hypothetical protein MH204_09295, partial [Fimbriimonadaceae bacterium]|nr:hypothetical protein [Fimbriimonadaceae bacterium]
SCFAGLLLVSINLAGCGGEGVASGGGTGGGGTGGGGTVPAAVELRNGHRILAFGSVPASLSWSRLPQTIQWKPESGPAEEVEDVIVPVSVGPGRRLLLVRKGTQPINARFIEPAKLSYGTGLVQVRTDDQGRFVQNLLLVDSAEATLTAQSDLEVEGVVFRQVKFLAGRAAPRTFGMFPQFSLRFTTTAAAGHRVEGTVDWGETFPRRAFRFRSTYANGGALNMTGDTDDLGVAAVAGGLPHASAGAEPTVVTLDIEIDR